MFADQHKVGAGVEDDGPALLQGGAVGDLDRVVGVVVLRRGLVADEVIRPDIGPTLLIEQAGIAGPQVADDERTGHQGVGSVIGVGQRPGQSEPARDLHVADQAHVLDAVHHIEGFGVTGQVQGAGQGHHAAVQVDAIERLGELLAVLVLHMGMGQPFAAGVELLPGTDTHGEGRLAGAVHHHDVAGADEGHPAIGRQAHRIQPDDVGIERQIAEHHAVEPNGVGHHTERAPDLAILPHLLGVIPGLPLVTGGRDLAAEAHPHHPGLVVHPAIHVGGGEIAVPVCRRLDAPPGGGVGGDVEAARGHRGARGAEGHRIHRLDAERGSQGLQRRLGTLPGRPVGQHRQPVAVVDGPRLDAGTGLRVRVAVEQPLAVHVGRTA
ncbi:hypothetical protein D3C76_862870 [compost metagenome]